MNPSSRLQILLVVALTAAACGKSSVSGNNLLPAPLDPNTVVSSVALDRTTGVLANGTDSATLTVTMQDGNQKPLAGVTIAVSVSGGSNIIGKAATTDTAGVTRVTLGSTVAGEKTVTVTAATQGAGIVLPTQPILDFVGVVLSASSASQPADGNSAAHLTVTMKDTKGVGAAGVSVTLAATGSNNLLNSMYGTTDANGVFTTTLVSTQAEIKTITATAATMISTATATFTASNSCLATLQLPAVPWPGLHHPSGYTLADFNRDGTQDAVVTSSADATSAIYLGRGDGTFSQAISVGLDNNTVFLVSADFNGDKRPDVAGLSGTSPYSSLYVAMGNGDGTFSPPTYYTVDPNAQGIVANDFDHDTYADLVIYGNDNHIAAYLYVGNNGFSAPYTSFLGQVPTAIVTGKFDSDNDPDLAFTNAIDPNLQVLLGDGQGGFTTGAALNIGFFGAPYLSVGLLNGDAQPDIVAGFPNIFSIGVFLGNPNGTFYPKNAVQTGGNGLSRLAIGDINHDTFADIVTLFNPLYTPYGPLVATAYLGGGDGSFLSSQTYAIPYDLSDISFADVNSDQRSDLIGISTANPSLVTIIAQAGRAFPSYGWSAPTSTLSSPSASLLSSDFNGDGNQDLLVNAANTNTLTVLRGTGNGNFTVASNPNVGPNAGLSAVADFNGDNVPDVAVVGNGNHITIVLGNGDGTFGQAYNANTLYAPLSIVAANFNSDKYADIAVAVDKTYPINVLINTGDGNFMPATTPSANPASTVVAGDFTGDGNIDLMLEDQSNRNLNLLAGNGDGTFKQGAAVRLGAANPNEAFVYKMATGDLNQDGKLDIVATGGYTTGYIPTPSVTVWLNAGNGNFTVAPPFGNFHQASIGVPSIADVNGDQVLDIAINDTGNSVLKVYVGRGNGTFEPSVEYGWGQLGPFYTAVADYNKDHRPDVASLGFNDVQVIVAGSCLVSSTTYFDRAD